MLTPDKINQEFELEEDSTCIALVTTKSDLKIPITLRELQYLFDIIEKDNTYPMQMCIDKELDLIDFGKIYRRWHDKLKTKLEIALSDMG